MRYRDAAAVRVNVCRMRNDITVRTVQYFRDLTDKTYSVNGYYFDLFHIITPVNKNRDISVSASSCLFAGKKAYAAAGTEQLIVHTEII